MLFETVQALCEPGGTTNEDRCGAVERCAWVLDGASGIGGARILPGPSDAAWFAEHVHRNLRTTSGDHRSCRDWLRAAALLTIDDYLGARTSQETQAWGMPSASCIVARLVENQLELASLGDCLAIVKTGHGISYFGGPLSERTDTQLMSLFREGCSGSALAEQVTALERARRSRMNQEDGYWIVDLSERGVDHCEIHTVTVRSGDRLLLLSDGFTRLVDVFGRYSYDTLYPAADAHGLPWLLAELRSLETGDAQNTKFPRVKQHDDASAMMLRIVD